MTGKEFHGLATLFQLENENIENKQLSTSNVRFTSSCRTQKMTNEHNIYSNFSIQSGSSLIKTRICRLCLVNGADILIFDNTSVLSNMTQCNIMVLRNDGLPENICANCHIRLIDAAKFLNQCQENEKILRENRNIVDNFDKIESHIDQEKDTAYYKDDVTNVYSYYGSEDYVDSDETSSHDEEDRRLMETIVKSENGEEYIYISGIKVIVNRSQMLVDEKVQLKIKRKKENVTTTKKIKDVLCPVCGKTSIKSLTAHMKLHGERVFSCEICAKAFPIRKKLTQHMIVHSNIRKHKCDCCEKCFKTGSDKRKHINAMHREPLVLYPCIVCKKLFKKQQGLMEHMKVHTREKNYECSVCRRKFAYKVTLTIHMRVHTGERPYTCTYCDKSFSASQTLREHVRLHTGEKPYDCPVCKKGFMQLSNMKSHFRNNHKGIEFKRKNIVKTYK